MGVGTVVVNASEIKELAARFVTFVKLSNEGSIRAWEELGFDSVNTEVWPDLETPAKVSEYYVNDLLEILLEYNPNTIESPKINGDLVDMANEINTSMYFDIFELDKEEKSETEIPQDKFS